MDKFNKSNQGNLRGEPLGQPTEDLIECDPETEGQDPKPAFPLRPNDGLPSPQGEH